MSTDKNHATGSRLPQSLLLLLVCTALARFIVSSPDAETPVYGSQSGASSSTTAKTPNSEEPSGKDAADVETPELLYGRHCAACHGENGNGQGRAARYLFPKPRNFRVGRFRSVSTENRRPTFQNLLSVVENGIPGTSMPAFKKLSEQQRKMLVERVLLLWKEATRESIIAYLKEDLSEGEAVEPQLVERLMKAKTGLAPPVEVPAGRDSTPEVIDRGKTIYASQNCHACHGADGRGHRGQDLVNDNGVPTRVPDFVVDYLKSGRDPKRMFLQIRLGMPGTPMPSSRNLSADDTQALVAFCQSLGRTPKRSLTNHQRAMLAIGHEVVTPPAARTDSNKD